MKYQWQKYNVKSVSRSLIYLAQISTYNSPLIKTALPLNTPVSLLMTYAAESPVAEEQLQRLKQIQICNFDLAHKGQKFLKGQSKLLTFWRRNYFFKF